MIAKRLLAIQKASSPPAPAATDVYYDYRSLILNMQGSAGSTTFTDSSPNNFTVTPYGNAQLATVPGESVAFLTAASFDGNGDYLTVASSAILAFSGDFTIEFWIYPTSTAVQRLISFPSNKDQVLIVSGGAVNYFDGTTDFTTSSALSLNSWNHVSVVKRNGLIYIYLNGLLSNTPASSSYTSSTARSVTIGRYADSALQYFNGLIGPLRISPWAVYKSNFTPSANLFPAAPDSIYANPYYDKVALSLKFDGTNGSTNFVDTGPNAFAVTPSGNAQITSASKYGSGAGAFDGNGDYLTVANNAAFNFGSGDLTVECWVNFAVSVSGVDYCIAGQGTSAFTSNAGWILARHNSNKLRFIFTDNGTSSYRICDSTSSFLPTVGTWYHLCAVKRSGVVTLYINGVNSGSASLNYSVYASTLNLSIGADSVGGIPINGSIDELEITPGVAKYKANFTPPVRGLSTIYNPYTTLPVSGAALWLDGADSSTLFTDAGVTPVAKSGDLVYQWSDKSGNNRHATQATSANRPTWVPPASGQNGFGVLNFNGTANFFVGDWQTYTDLTLFIVAKNTNANSPGGRIFSQSDSTLADNVQTPTTTWIPAAVISPPYFVSTNTSQSAVMQVAFTNNTYQRFIHRKTGTTGSNTVGSATVSGTIGTITRAMTRYCIGRNTNGTDGNWAGQICEMIAFPRQLTGSEETAVNSYLNAKWGTP